MTLFMRAAFIFHLSRISLSLRAALMCCYLSFCDSLLTSGIYCFCSDKRPLLQILLKNSPTAKNRQEIVKSNDQLGSEAALAFKGGPLKLKQVGASNEGAIAMSPAFAVLKQTLK
jgi:hypothetical protein